MNDREIANSIVNAPFRKIFGSAMAASLQFKTLQEVDRAIDRMTRTADGDPNAYHEAAEQITGNDKPLSLECDIAMLAAVFVALRPHITFE